MYDVTIIYDDPQTKELFDMVPNIKELHVEYLDVHNKKDRGSAFRIKRNWASRKNPFVVVKKDDKVEKVFYSEDKDDAVNQLIKWINESKD